MMHVMSISTTHNQPKVVGTMDKAKTAAVVVAVVVVVVVPLHLTLALVEVPIVGDKHNRRHDDRWNNGEPL